MGPASYSSKQKLIVAIKKIAFRVLPAALVFWLWHLNTRRRPRYLRGDLSDLEEIQVQDRAVLYLGWAEVTGVGAGPAASLYVHNEEVLRLDCFGGTAGHMHLNPEQNKLIMTHGSARIYFQPGSREEHVDRAAFELVKNTRGALAANKLSRVRGFELDTEKITAAAERMIEGMRKLIIDHQ